MNQVYLSLGSNEGDRVLWFKKALHQIEDCCGAIINKSSIYETAAWGKSDQPDFLNMVVLVATELQPLELLKTTQKIETLLGRKREIKWGPRTLDIDILFYNNLVSIIENLTIPHPFVHERRFTLLPMSEITPNYIHPVLNKTISELLEICPDRLSVKLSSQQLDI